MTHLKRLTIEKSWPLPKKGTKYLMVPYPGKKAELAIPLGIVLRDLLKLASNRREVKEMLHKGEILVDGKTIKDEKLPLSIFDILSVPNLKKFYRITLAKRKISLEEIPEKETNQKSCKVIGKTVLKRGIQQINCFDGRSILSKEKVAVGDSIIFNLKEKKIIGINPLKTGAEVLIIGGAHVGSAGKIVEKNEKIKVQIKNKPFEIQAKNLYVK